MASPTSMVAGQSITFTATVDNSTEPYSYTLANGLGSTLTGMASNSAFSQTLTARGSGPQTYTLTVEKKGVQASTSIPVTVQPVVITELSASPNPVPTGQPFTLNATVGNVSGPYTFTLSNGIDTPHRGLASGDFSQTLTAHGFGAQTYTFTVAANDNWATTTVQVNVLPRPIPITGLSASPTSVVAGQPTTFTATVGEVSGNYSYTLSNGAYTPLSGTANSPAFSQSLTAQGSGPQTFTLTVATNDGVATATTSLTVLAKPVTLTGLSASPNPVVAGQPVQFTATLANLKGGYAYSLANGQGSTLTGTADATAFSQSLIARGSGPQTYTLTVTPFNEPTAVYATVAITVSPGPAVADGPVCADFVNRPLPNASPVTGVYAVGSTVYAATENGLAISTDGGNTFPSLHTTESGLGANKIHAVYAVGSTVYVATQNGLSISTNEGQSFTNHTTGLGDNQVMAVSMADNTIYVATPGGLAVSTNGGQSFTNRTSTNGLGDNRVNGVSVVNNTVYAATDNGLSISTNGGSSFAINRTTVSPGGIASNVVLGVYAIGLSVYVATDNGLSISTDGGQTFANRTTGNKLGSNNVHAVYAVGNTVYAATNNGLSISIDGGQTFTNYTTANTSNGLGSDIVAGVSVAGERIYAATRGGVSFCPPPVVNPILTNLSASPNPVQAGQPTTFTATVGGVTGAYSYTLANGVTPPLSGTASGTVFSQSLSAEGSGLQMFTLTMATGGGVATASTALSVISSGVSITGLRPSRQAVPVGESVEFTATLTGLVDADIYSYTLTNGHEEKPLTGDFHGPDFKESVTAQGSGPQTFTLTLTSDKGRATATASILVTRLSLVLLRFAIAGVIPVSCEAISGDQRQVRFTPQYVATNGEPISFSVVNELAPTTSPGPYTLRLYTDNPTITLVASQGGKGEVRFTYNWLAACQGAPTPPQPPTTSGIPSQTLGVGQPYQLRLTDYVTDPDGHTPQFAVEGLPAGLSLAETLISGTPSTTGTYPVSLTATDPGGLSITVGFTLTVIPVSSSPLGFTIVGVTPVSCALTDSLKQGYRVSFMPQYGGVMGLPISFSVVNEFLPTLSAGPYTLNLYADNPTITLKASQQGSPGDASFSYNWLAACRAQTPVNPGSFALTGVTTVRCEMVSSGQRRVSFTPQYAGLDGSPVSFSVVNEKLPTTEKGPYSLNLYTDNPTVTLSAQQGSQVATYIYHWLTACQAPARLGAGEPEEGLQVRVLGNPIEGGQTRLEIRGAAGQRIDLQLVDLQGRLLHTQRLEATGSPEPVTVPVGPGRGALLLEVRTRTERQQIKLIKSD